MPGFCGSVRSSSYPPDELRDDLKRSSPSRTWARPFSSCRRRSCAASPRAMCSSALFGSQRRNRFAALCFFCCSACRFPGSGYQVRQCGTRRQFSDGLDEVVNIIGLVTTPEPDDPVQTLLTHEHVLLSVDRLNQAPQPGCRGGGQPVDVTGRAGIELGGRGRLRDAGAPCAGGSDQWGQIRHQLLDHLRGDHDRPVRPLRGLPQWSEAVEEIASFVTVADGEARMS